MRVDIIQHQTKFEKWTDSQYCLLLRINGIGLSSSSKQLCWCGEVIEFTLLQINILAVNPDSVGMIL